MRTAILISNGRLATEIRLRLGEERGFEEVATIESLPGVERIAAVVEELEVEALFVEVPAAGGVEWLRGLCRTLPEVAVVACAEKFGVAEAVEWLRAGARDCFRRGMAPGDVKTMLGRIRAGGAVAGFVSLKPGAGASTLAEQMAYVLNRQGKRVLLVDLNTMTGTTASWADGPDQPDVLQAIGRRGELNSHEAWREATSWRHGVRVLPAPLVPVEDAGEHWESGLSELLLRARRHFDWTLVDLPPAAEACAVRTAAELDHVVAVATPDLASLHLASRRLEELAAGGVEAGALRVVLNRTTRHDWLGRDRLEALFGHAVSVALPEDVEGLCAVGRGELRGDSRLAGAVRSLACTLIGRAQPAHALHLAPAALMPELAVAV